MALELKVAPVESHDVSELAGKKIVCELRKTNMILYGMFVELVREFYRFQTPYLIGVPDVRWDPDPQRTGIWIDSELNWNAAHPEFTPAIYVKLGEVQYSSPLGDGPALSGIANLKDGTYKTIRLGRSSVTFVHVGGNAGEACALCDNTRSYLSDFADPIRSDFSFTKFYEQGASPLQQREPDSKERWQSASVFGLEWREETTIKREAPVLRSVDFSLQDSAKYGILSSRLSKPDQHTGDYR